MFCLCRFVKRSNENKGAAGLLEVRQAYEFTLEVLGHDVASGPIWNEYLSFLQVCGVKSEKC